MVHVLHAEIPCHNTYRVANEILKNNPGDVVVVIPKDMDFFYDCPMELLIEYRDKLTEIIEGRMNEGKV